MRHRVAHVLAQVHKVLALAAIDHFSDVNETADRNTIARTQQASGTAADGPVGSNPGLSLPGRPAPGRPAAPAAGFTTGAASRMPDQLGQGGFVNRTRAADPRDVPSISRHQRLPGMVQ